MDIDQLKQLREETSAPLGECRKALEQSNNDMEKAKEILRKWGQTLANKKSAREVKTGIIDCYLHPNRKVGVVLALMCESDFVAKADDFLNLAHELCLQIAASNPLFIKPEDIPGAIAKKEKEIYSKQAVASGKPKQITDQMIEGKWKKYQQESCLLEQSWIKDENKKIKDLIIETVAKLGENIIVRDFKRLDLG